ncbi:MAG: FAD-binding protein [Caldilineaceae bacterium]|nr:FAD-binding protein [Caldilineaceae bacterium]
MSTYRINSSSELQSTIQQSAVVTMRGGGSKSALQSHAVPNAAELDLRGLSGILEYEPGEFTFTALAGTPLATVAATLAEHGQYLPFDPPFIEQGATLGGTVAAGLSGSGRYRFGGVRDFLIGVRFVDGLGRLVRGGGKVVKNAAGFDLPKLMVGSLGQFGVLTEVSFKVFPSPEAYTTLQASFTALVEALAALQTVVDSHFDIHALDLQVAQQNGQAPMYHLWIRLGGLRAVLPQRVNQLRQLIVGGEPLPEQEEAAFWSTVNEVSWAAAEATLVKVALTPGKIKAIETTLTAHGAQRHYAVGGNLAWIAWPGDLAALDQQLQTLGLTGLPLRGNSPHVYLGQRNGQHFARRIKAALDPQNRLPNYIESNNT